MVTPVLCVQERGVYARMVRDGWQLDLYHRRRPVQLYVGTGPILAHPPCRAWSAFLSHQANPPAGEAEIGPWVVEYLRSHGGVMEHPAHSRLWAEMAMPDPGHRDLWGGETLEVEQSAWGHWTRKRTWLYGVGIERWPELPAPVVVPPGMAERYSSACTEKRSATPRPFAEWLIAAVQSARNP
jgi:hypothetical protein